MNPYKKIVSALQWVGSFLVLAGFLGMDSFAAPIPLPDWVKPIESSLPRVPPEVISEVDDIYSFLRSGKERYGPESEAKIDLRHRRLVELQDQGEQAKIWQYLKDTDGPYGIPLTLNRLADDRDLAAWLLPIVRFRIEWLKQAMHNPEQKKYLQEVFRGMEIYDISTYLYKQGEFSDIENLNLFENEATKLKFQLQHGIWMRNPDINRLHYQVKDMQEARKLSEQQNEPVWKLTARNLIKKGVLTADALKPRPSGDESNGPKPLGPRQPLPEIKLKTISGFVQPWMMGPMWLLILAVSAGLLRWVFRKLRRAPDHAEPNLTGGK